MSLIRSLETSGRLGHVARILLRPLAAVLMIHNPWVGLLLWLVVAAELHRGLFALLGLLLGEAVRLALQLDDRTGSGGLLKANALLTSLAVAWLLPAAELPLSTTLALIALAAGLAAILSAAFVRALEGSGQPPLVWGYCIVAGLFFIIFPEWALRSALTTDWGALPVSAVDWVDAFFRTLGAFLFAPAAAAGLIIALAILLWSRTMFLAGVFGWCSGILTALVLTEAGVLFYWLPAAYNFFLAGVALGSVYYLPGWGSLLAAAGAGSVAAFVAVGLQHLLDFSSAAFLPVPFCLTAWIGLGALQSAAKRGHLNRNRLTTLRPEDAWWLSEHEAARWGRHENLLMIPLTGEVQITQGFSGSLSHAGHWPHALDFERPHRARPIRGGHQSILGARVLAPAPGTVVRMRDDVPDNPVGVSNYAENWGNYVVIGLDAGGWALLAHLRQGSVAVNVGARVEFGTVLGTVGNSGRSPVPHLHLHVQEGPEPGAPTLPFRLANYLYAERAGDPLLNWTATGVPTEGTVLKAARSEAASHRILAGMSPGRALWSLEIHGVVPIGFRPASQPTSLRVDASLDASGRQVIRARDGGRLLAQFHADAWRVVGLDAEASVFLRLLAIAIPCIPYAAVKGLRWSDIAVQAPDGYLGWLARSMFPYRTTPFTMLNARCTKAPSSSNDILEVETRPAEPGRNLPQKVICQLRDGEGPIRLVAEFERGSLVYSLYTFVPILPYPVASDLA